MTDTQTDQQQYCPPPHHSIPGHKNMRTPQMIITNFLITVTDLISSVSDVSMKSENRFQQGLWTGKMENLQKLAETKSLRTKCFSLLLNTTIITTVQWKCVPDQLGASELVCQSHHWKQKISEYSLWPPELLTSLKQLLNQMKYVSKSIKHCQWKFNPLTMGDYMWQYTCH